MELQGYQRRDGRVGFRNHVLILPLTGCAADLARRIAEQVPGTTCFAHPNGCDLQGGDFDLMGRILEQTCTHPNVGAVLFLSMGCSAALGLKLPAKAEAAGRAVRLLNTQQVGGTTRTVELGTAAARELAAALAREPRRRVGPAALVVGTKCGASDAHSFEHCHPVVGRACDILAAEGATIVLSEDCELVAGAEALAGRAATADVAEKIRTRLGRDVNAMWKSRFGYTLEEFVVQHGTEKDAWARRSLEHAAKAGTGPIAGFFEMGELVRGPGLVILNGPNTDLECVTCLAAAGCQVTLFTTGRGTCVGSPTSITLKITATRKTAETMAENIDLCVDGLVEGRRSIDDEAQRVVAAVLEAANGRATASERLRHTEVALPIRGVTF